MVAKFWIKQLLIKPDPSPYLLANKMPAVRLYAGENEPLYWTNPSRVIENTLSGKALGTSPFVLQFAVHSKAITDGTTQLLDAPGLMNCIAQDETLYFKFAWELPWYSLDKKYLKSGWNPVALVSDGTNITLQVNEYVSVILDTSQKIAMLDYTLHSVSVDGDQITGASGGYVSVNGLDGLNFGTANSWEIGASFVYAAGASGHNGVFGTHTNYYAPELDIDLSTNKLYVNLSSTGTSRDIADSAYADFILSPNTRYWTKLKFTGSAYIIAVSTDGATFQEQTVVSSSARVYNGASPNLVFMNRRMGNGQNYWLKGPLYTSYTDTYIIADGVEYGKTYSYPITYPQLTVGQISSQVDWTKVRNIKAVIL
ncbi:MAG: hypothetical protein ACI351_05900 [Candidatus Avelusimicrobium sp.]|uniref:hypothetical protein n=1 Tax=Candidatus Avelusimicrobium sp. TaxID=3048833 RepID=UPI003F0A217D